MPFSYDESTRTMTLPLGDTATFHISIDWMGLSPGDALVFGIYNKSELTDIFRKPAEIVDGQAVLRLCNADTRDLEPGNYRWQLRIVTDPARDEDGNIITDACADNVISIFDPDDLPKINLKRGGAYV